MPAEERAKDQHDVQQDGEDDLSFKVIRGEPLVATVPRWAAFAAAEAAIASGFGYAYVSISNTKASMTTIVSWVALTAVALAMLSMIVLRSEEARLARELRTARSGTPGIRGMVLGRRQKAPFFLKFFTTTFGTAAVLVADGDPASARQVLESSSPFMQSGRLGQLREVVEADIERARHDSVGLERCVQRLRGAVRIGNREADRYKTHVLVKAILEQGDAETGLELLEEIAKSKDDEERYYAVWLAAWFSAEMSRFGEGEMRLASLLARTSGADELVGKLEAEIERLSKRSAPAPDPA